jgi:hypothetical protein
MRARTSRATKKQQNKNNTKYSGIEKVKKERVTEYVAALESTDTSVMKDNIFQPDKDIVVKEEEFMDEKSSFLQISTVEKGEKMKTIILGLYS